MVVKPIILTDFYRSQHHKSVSACHEAKKLSKFSKLAAAWGCTAGMVCMEGGIAFNHTSSHKDVSLPVKRFCYKNSMKLWNKWTLFKVHHKCRIFRLLHPQNGPVSDKRSPRYNHHGWLGIKSHFPQTNVWRVSTCALCFTVYSANVWICVTSSILTV